MFSFYPDGRFCEGFEQVLSRYRELVPQLRLSGSEKIRSLDSVDFSSWFWNFLTMILKRGVCTTRAGPTSFAPVIEMAMSIVDESRGQYHVLLIIADGQVRSSIPLSLSL